jgi:hypothetical protein
MLARDIVGTALEDPRQRDSSRQDHRSDVRENDTGCGGRQNRGDSPGGASSQITLSGLLNSLDYISIGARRSPALRYD